MKDHGKEHKMKILWLSRHNLAEDQIADLKKYLQQDDLEIVTKNILWQASTDSSDDLIVNKQLWKQLFMEASIVAGVIPPVAIEALHSVSGVKSKTILSAVSEQQRKIREDGNAIIEFKHLRWCKLN